MLLPLSVLFGAVVGFTLGLAGGGGSLLAVPLLVYGLAIDPREAFGISLAAVGATALVGLLPRIRAGNVEVVSGVWFAISGMIAAPLGTKAATLIPETALLVLFAVLMFAMAWQMAAALRTSRADPAPAADGASRPFCRQTPDGHLRITPRCATLLAVAGLATGFLSGMFGVGGGFVIVPALVVLGGLGIHRAVATSMLVIVLVSMSGVAAHMAAGRGIPPQVTSLFVAGGVVGVLAGGQLSKRISGPTLQKAFATGMVAVAIFIVSQTLV